MSSPDQAPPPAPDDDDYSPEPTLDQQVQADLIRHTELIAVRGRKPVPDAAHGFEIMGKVVPAWQHFIDTWPSIVMPGRGRKRSPKHMPICRHGQEAAHGRVLQGFHLRV